MNTPTVFGVYTARFPFLESDTAKIRPVVVIGMPHSEHKALVVIPISSNPSAEDVDVVLNDWGASGLLKPSTARIHRLTTILQVNLLSYLGTLSDKDQDTVKTALRRLLPV